jgi:hypothetical protein
MYFNLQKLFFVQHSLRDTSGSKHIPDSINAYDLFSRSIREAMNKDFSVETIYISVSCVLLFVLAVVFFEIYRSNKSKKGLLNLAWKKFEAQVAFLRLSQNKIDILVEIVNESGLQDPNMIIKSPHLFEKALEAYYDVKKINSISSTRLASIRELRKSLHFLPLSKEMAFTSTRQFEAGEKCMVQIPESGTSTHRGMCEIKVVGEKYWSISRLSGPPIPAKTLVFANLVRAGDAEYAFKAQVLQETNEEIVLAHVNKLNRAQQRNWVRIDVSIPVEVTQLLGNDTGDIFSGKIIDMSGGGFGMALPIKLSNNSKLLLNFELPGQGTIIDLPVKVVRVAGKYNNDSLKTIHSVAFDGDVHLIQEQIIQYVFEKQRQNSMLAKR